ncbi:MAG: radical SAM protein [Nitrososphaerales archaeon]
MIIDALRMIRFGMANPLFRIFLRIGTLRSTKGYSLLELALANYAGESSPSSIIEYTYSLIIKLLFDRAAEAFGVNRVAVQDFLRPFVIRRGIANILIGIAINGVTKPQIINAPFLVVWNLTNMCNLRCKHCYQSAGKPSPDELTLNEKLQVVNQLADAGVVVIALSGGEPIMHPHFLPVVKEARRRGIYVAVATNGTLITKDMAKKMKEAGVCYVEVSLDSIKPEVHDNFRGVKGAWERAIQGIKNCVEQGIFTAVATTVTKLNMRDVPDLIRLAKKLGARRFIHFNFIPTGRGKEVIELDLSPLEREELLKLLYKESEEVQIEVMSTAPQYARVVLQTSIGKSISPTHFYIGEESSWRIQTLADFIGGCGSGRLYCAIQPNGDVTPCVFIPQLILGNLRKRSFMDIWHNNKVLKKFQCREHMEGFCNKCKYKYVCGGCRARSISYFNRILAPDVGCIYNQQIWGMVTKGIRAKLTKRW